MSRRIPAAAYTWLFVVSELAVLGPLALALLRRLGRPFDRPPSRLDLTSAYILGVGYLVLFRFMAYSAIAHIPLPSCLYG